MLWNDALGAAIEVAIAIAGFSGIIAAVGRSRGAQRIEAGRARVHHAFTVENGVGFYHG